MLESIHKPVLVALSGNEPLAQKISERLGIPLAKQNLDRFADGEIRFNLDDSVRGANVYIIQSTSAEGNNSVNDAWMELYISIDALRRASAHSINIIMPYYGYARQDRKARSREAITSRMVADLLERVGADRLVALDLHATQIQGFFDIPVDHLIGAPILADYLICNGYVDDNTVVASPDHGGVKRARELTQFLGLEESFVVLDKRRPTDQKNTVEVMNLIGNVEGKTVIMVDDIIDTGNTIAQGAKLLKKKGATKVIAAATHALLNGNAVQNLQDSDFDHVVVTDSIVIPESKKFPKLEIVSTDDLFAKAIEAIQDYKSVSPLFQNKYHRG
ncbi:MAG: ribose-phosphate pyrophosphokinase [Lactobacillaceae bacterium]|jgi:ribose-phosphate pyrophosphokinase|nr:ribose-phosphate pyrophosphokinase [Lactobacillaceae bacterium]